MGVPGLWDILRPAGETRSLTHLAVVDGFEANPAGVRGFRVGIDASIWFFHAAYGREGENPELRTLFFKCTRLMSAPFLPLFVFDGPKRPEMKRGKHISGKNHWLIQGMQEIINAFGFEWRMAPAEAEAELAYLNRIGAIDAVMTDDVDTFVFGASMVVRNSSITLSGNRAHALKNADGRDDGNHAAVYRMKDILNHPEVKLTQGGLVLIALLRGGDYQPEGLIGCGPAIAHALARCGFGDSLLGAARTLSDDDLEDFLVGWREEIRQELRTNSRGMLGKKSPSLAKAILEDFPDINVLEAYVHPLTSEPKGSTSKNVNIDWEKEPDLGKIAGLCEMYFEWGVKEIIIKRFRTVLWPSAVLRILRRSVLLADKKAARMLSRESGDVLATPRKKGQADRLDPAPGTPSKLIAKHFSALHLGSPTKHTDGAEDDGFLSSPSVPDDNLIVKIHSARQHASTDGILEYRLEIAPEPLVRICEDGVRGLRTALATGLGESDDDVENEEEGEKGKSKVKKPPPDPLSHLRVWLPASMVHMVHPELVEEFEGVKEKRAAKKAGKATSGAGRAATSKTRAKKTTSKNSDGDSDGSESSRSSRPTQKAAQRASKTKYSSSKTRLRENFTESLAGDGKGIDDLSAAARATAPSELQEEPRAKKSTALSQPKTNSKTRKISALFVEPAFSSDTGGQIRKQDILAESSDSESDDSLFLPNHLTSRTASSSTTSLSRSTSTSSRASNLLAALDKFDMAMRSEAAAVASRSRRQARPFPIAPTDEDELRPPTSTNSSTRTSPSKVLRRRSSASGSTGTSPIRLNKSPRKSSHHASPRSTPTHNRSEGAHNGRSGSPTPQRSRPLGNLISKSIKPAPHTAARLDMSVIEISSDSDSAASPIAPLRLEQANLTTKPRLPDHSKRATSNRLFIQVASKPRRRQPGAFDPDEVIDLT